MLFNRKKINFRFLIIKRIFVFRKIKTFHFYNQIFRVLQKKLNMNSNNTYINALIVDSFYQLFGSTWYTDALNVYFLIPVCIIGVILNLIVYKIIRNEKFHKILIFNFIRVNMINSILISLILSTTWLHIEYSSSQTRMEHIFICLTFTDTYCHYFISIVI